MQAAGPTVPASVRLPCGFLDYRLEYLEKFVAGR
jgi:hypothetical protein